MIVVIVMTVVTVKTVVCGVPLSGGNSVLDGVGDCAGTLSACDSGAPVAHSPGY